MKYILSFILITFSFLHAEKTYYSTGELKTETNYKYGKKTKKEYNKSGILKKKTSYKNGKIRYVQIFNNGKKLKKISYYSTGIKPSPTKITNTTTNIDLLSYGYIQENNNHFYKAYLAYDEVCDSGNLNGCFYLMAGHHMISELFYDARLKAEINGYPEKAIKMWGKECNNNDMLACFNLGRLYSKKADYKHTNGFYEIAQALYKKACDNGEMKGCMNITGKNTSYMRKDAIDKFIKNYTKACNNGELNACYRLGRYYDDFQYFKKANIMFEKACNNGEMKSCHALALSYEQARGRKKDYNKANKYYTKACNNEYMFSCSTMTRIQTYLPKENKTSNLLKKACEIGLGSSCISLGLDARTKHKAIEYFKKGCIRGDRESCDWIERAKNREYE